MIYQNGELTIRRDRGADQGVGARDVMLVAREETGEAARIYLSVEEVREIVSALSAWLTQVEE